MRIEARYRKRDSRTVYDVRLRDPSGREYSRTFLTKRAAEAYQAQERVDRDRGAWIDPRKAETTFGEVARAWLESNPGKSEGAVARDEGIVRNHINPSLEKRPVGSITRRDVQSLVARWSQALEPRTVSRQYDVLRAIFNYALDSDVLGRTPCRNVRLPKASAPRRQVLMSTQLADLAHAMGNHYAPLVYIGAMLGLRWGECAGLRVRDLDLLNRTVTVSGQRTRGTGGRMVEHGPKSLAGRRTLTMPHPLVVLLAAHLKARRLTAADADEYVFVGSRGRPLQYSAFRQRVWLPACELIGVPSLGFHDLRRTNATEMVRRGADVKTAQVRLGHADPRTTLGIYAQATTDADRAAADLLADLLDPPEEAARDERGMDGA
jgi:integrase